MELSLLVCIHKSYIVYLEKKVELIGQGFSFFGHGKVVEKSWKINVEREGHPDLVDDDKLLTVSCVVICSEYCVVTLWWCSCGSECQRGTWLRAVLTSRVARSCRLCLIKRSSVRSASVIHCTDSSCVLPFRRWWTSRVPQHRAWPGR